MMKICKKNSLMSVTALLFILMMSGGIVQANCNTDISQSPMETLMQAPPPNVMFVFDNSGSMDWEFMTPEDDGLFHETPPSSGYKYYLFPAADYDPDDDHNYSSSHTISEAQRKRWKYQWAGYNKIYYDPGVVYFPWPGASYGNADTASPRSNPVNSSPVFHLAGKFLEFIRRPYWVRLNADYRNNNSACCHYSADAVWIALHSDNSTSVRIDDNNYYNSSFAHFSIPDDDGTTNDWGTAHYNYDIYDKYHYNFAIDHDTWAQWSFAVPITGDYDVYVYYRTLSTRYSDISYTIEHANGESVVSHLNNDPSQPVISHNSADGQGDTWQPLGTFHFDADNNIITIYNAHYFVLDDTNQNGEPDAGEHIYLVNFEDTDGNGTLDTRKYYLFDDQNNNDVVDSGEELIPVKDLYVPDSIKAYNRDSDGNPTTPMTFSEELQNFANWFSYYRRRELTAKAAVAVALDVLDGVNIGYYTINSGLRKTVRYLNDNREALYNDLFSINSYGYTPLRWALNNVGYYFDADDGKSGNLGPAPWETEENGGSCQQAFAIVMTDGYWNGDSPPVGNWDGDDGVPFADNVAGTLADVARKYYKLDLSDSLPNAVPVNECDDNTKQHLVTYGLSFGVKGELDPSYDAYQECMLGVINGDPAAPPAPQWPNPKSCNACGKKIDDLWHASVNGRGTFISAQNSQELVDALARIASNISSRAASGAAVSINSEKLTEDTVLYQSSYDSSTWTGTLKAYQLNAVTGEQSDEIWDAATKLNQQDWDTGRKIFTAVLTGDGLHGMPFRYDNLNSTQKSYLNNSAEVVNFLRGKEVAGFRNRAAKLGDLVHSAPTLVKHTVFVGGNDGMLHAFNADTGEERFAFVPNGVYPNLKYLTQSDYKDKHKFYVDLTPTVSSNETILVGGLGAGGKGYFALNISNADLINSESSEDDVAGMFLWEYPRPDVIDRDLGLSMSKVSIVKTNAGPTVAIFGNGYNSENCHAVLYILNLETGAVIKKIDTGASGGNGLSTPVAVDVDGDFKADYVYAGDLKGNLWKFDISSSSVSDWDVAYKNDDIPVPLFTAKDQPITVRPDVMRHCSKHGNIVVFATGKFMGIDDPQDQSLQTVYGVWDYGENQEEYIGMFDASTGQFVNKSPELSDSNVTMLQQTVISSSDGYIYVSSNNATWTTAEDSNATDHLANPAANVGWYMNFAELGERAGKDIIIRNGRAIVVSVTPVNNKCSGGGTSTLYEFDACSGSGPGSPIFDTNGDGNLDDDDVGKNENEGRNPAGKKFETILHDPVFVNIPGRDQEFKYFSTSQGTIVRVREPSEYLGIYYWIEW